MVTIPTKKISETILDFAEPYLSLLHNFSTEEFEAAMNIVVCAWNAVVLDAQNQTDKYEKMFFESLSALPKEFGILNDIPKALIERKKSEFSHDPRAVRNHQVIEKDSGLTFRAEACLNLQDAKVIIH